MKVKDLTPEQKILWDSVRAYASWAVADSWKGGGDPADAPKIAANFKVARQAMINLVGQYGVKPK